MGRERALAVLVALPGVGASAFGQKQSSDDASSKTAARVKRASALLESQLCQPRSIDRCIEHPSRDIEKVSFELQRDGVRDFPRSLSRVPSIRDVTLTVDGREQVVTPICDCLVGDLASSPSLPSRRRRTRLSADNGKSAKLTLVPAMPSPVVRFGSKSDVSTGPAA
ncbi:hypothetical protein D3C71_731730 [compost metagenome]